MSTAPGGGNPAGDFAPDEQGGVRFTDKRRIDPQTGEVRGGDEVAPDPIACLDSTSAQVQAAQAKADVLTEQLARMQADFVNFRRRSEREQLAAHELGVAATVEALIPALDDVDAARAHQDLTGPFAAIVEKVEASLARLGWERYGTAGEPFDPTVHEALTHTVDPTVSEPTISMVYQAGHRVNERIIRAAKVGVVDADS